MEIHGELARAHVESIGVLTKLYHVVQLDYNLAEPIRGYVALKFACQSVRLGTESEFRQLQYRLFSENARRVVPPVAGRLTARPRTADAQVRPVTT